MHLSPIGHVKSPQSDRIDQGWGEIISEIHLKPSLTPGLIGLEEFSHALVVFYMHHASMNLKTDLVRHPQGRHDLPKIGIFAQRAKHRPNPIGVTAVKIISIKDNILTVKGLDAIDGTPILDVKPYFPQFDKVNAKTPKWVNEIMRDYF